MGFGLPYAATHRFSKITQGSLTCFLILSSSQSPEAENLPTAHTGKLRPQSPNDGRQRMIPRLVHQGAPRSSTKLQNGERV